MKIFFLKLFVIVYALQFRKSWKKVVMLVFFDPKRSIEFFLIFWKKSKKWEKLHFFHFFSYGLATIFTFFILLNIMWKSELLGKKKCQKKRDFIFWNSFLKMKIGHLFLSIFEFKKKVYKKGIFFLLFLFGEMGADGRGFL